MKRIIFLLAALTAILSVPASAAAILAVNPAFQSVFVGDPVSVSIALTGDNVGDYDIVVTWNPAIVSLDSLVQTTVLGTPITEADYNAVLGPGTANPFGVSFLPVGDLLALQGAPGGTRTLFTLNFTALAPGITPVTLSVNAIGDESGQPIADLSLANGQIEVLDGNGGGRIPEPSTWLLIGAGLALVGVRRRA